MSKISWKTVMRWHQKRRRRNKHVEYYLATNHKLLYDLNKMMMMIAYYMYA